MSPTFYVAGKKVDAVGPESVLPGNVGVYILNESQLAELPRVSEIKVTTEGGVDIVTAIIKSLWRIFRAPTTVTGLVTGFENGILFQDVNGTDLAALTSEGKMGLGTIEPDSKLHIIGGGNDILRVQSTGPIAMIYQSTNAGQTVEHYADANGYQLNVPLAGDDIRFITQGIATQGITIKSGGNVGIGTTAPTAQLTVGVDDGTGTPGGAASTARLALAPPKHTGGDWVFTARDNTPTTGRAYLDIGYGTTGASALAIDNLGNVGIGTTNPSAKLEVTGASNGAYHFSIEGTNSVDGATFGSRDGNAQAVARLKAHAGVGNKAGDLRILGTSIGQDNSIILLNANNGGALLLGTNGNERLTITSSGNVGIGTNSPGQKLSVAGIVESTSGGFKFPDGTVQTTAGGGGGSGGIKVYNTVQSSYYSKSCNNAFDDIPGLSLTFTTSGTSILDIAYAGLVSNNANDGATYAVIFLDGSPHQCFGNCWSGYRNPKSGQTLQWATAAAVYTTTVSAGSHTAKVRLYCDSGTGTANNGALRVVVYPQ